MTVCRVDTWGILTRCRPEQVRWIPVGARWCTTCEVTWRGTEQCWCCGDTTPGQQVDAMTLVAHN